MREWLTSIDVIWIMLHTCTSTWLILNPTDICWLQERDSILNEDFIDKLSESSVGTW